MLKDQGNKNKENPTGKEKKVSKTLKNKLQARYNVDVKNKFSALNGLTEAKEKNLFNNEKGKNKKELKGKEKCETECDEALEEPSTGKSNRKSSRNSRKLLNESIKDVNVTFDNKPKFNCCNRHHMSVLVTAFLACSGLRNYANLQTSFICDISKFKTSRFAREMFSSAYL
ncbi:unnamed protein product [Meloidogyne enterolobii]|uniref:Uncharacterized protein n=1 Tax=Meloidogyne enterolobii TaxID=390850 RepID=A0ACB0XK88_MELEN